MFSCAGIEPKKGDDDGKYISINVRMQRTQVSHETFLFMFTVKKLTPSGLLISHQGKTAPDCDFVGSSASVQHGVLSKEFVELMGRCNTIQAQYRDRNVERIQRQLKISESTENNTQSLLPL